MIKNRDGKFEKMEPENDWTFCLENQLNYLSINILLMD